ncbi:unnamed protein product [Lymnaea stagnalis]|uniref:Uncharacterized protein n=1 Tax=Lymnaea stagnalis TaxID=6523 RepID=A0AAV2HS77_LYMST
MASKTRKSDPLSRYFEELNDDDLSNSSDDELTIESNGNGKKLNIFNANKKVELNTSNSKNDTTSSKSASCKDGAGEKLLEETNKFATKKLPSAHECLKSQSKPAFLQVLEKREPNWDVMEKRLDKAEDSESTINFKSNAVPPPSTYEPMTDPGIKVVDQEGRKRKNIGDDLQDQMTSTKAFKVHKDDKEEDDKEEDDN